MRRLTLVPTLLKIQKIEATGAVLPFNSKNGWSDFLR
jgi:hypothetical protein